MEVKDIMISRYVKCYTAEELAELLYEAEEKLRDAKNSLHAKNSKYLCKVHDDKENPDELGTKNLGLAIARDLLATGMYTKRYEQTTKKWVYKAECEWIDLNAKV